MSERAQEIDTGLSVASSLSNLVVSVLAIGTPLALIAAVHYLPHRALVVLLGFDGVALDLSIAYVLGWRP